MLTDLQKIEILVNAVGVTGPTGKISYELALDDDRKTFKVNLYDVIATNGCNSSDN
jgi:hypothetical protein